MRRKSPAALRLLATRKIILSRAAPALIRFLAVRATIPFHWAAAKIFTFTAAAMMLFLIIKPATIKFPCRAHQLPAQVLVVQMLSWQRRTATWRLRAARARISLLLTRKATKLPILIQLIMASRLRAQQWRSELNLPIPQFRWPIIRKSKRLTRQVWRLELKLSAIHLTIQLRPAKATIRFTATRAKIKFPAAMAMMFYSAARAMIHWAATRALILCTAALELTL